MCAAEILAHPCTFRRVHEKLSPFFYSIYPHIFHLDFSIRDDRNPLLAWLFGLYFLSSQQMCAKSKIRHTTGYLFFQRGCRKGIQVIYKFVESSVIITSCCYFRISLGITAMREQECRKHIYNTVDSSFPLSVEQLANVLNAGVTNSLSKSLNCSLFST